MKKIVYLGLAWLLTLTAGTLFAWTPAQLSFWPGAKNLPSNTNVYGFKLGLPYSTMDSGYEKKIVGLDFGAISDSYNITGLQLSMVNIDTNNVTGVQLGGASSCTDFDGLQLGGFNQLSNGKGAQLGLFNAGNKENKTLQIGVVNTNENNSKGIEVGVFNNASNYHGFQLGILNIDNDVDLPTRQESSTFQFGLLNFNDHGFLPFCILVNF